MHTIQYDGEMVPSTKRVFYYAGAGPITQHPKPGYAVCYDIAADVDGGGDVRHKRGVRVVKPATANLEWFAGIVKNVSATKEADGYSCYMDIYEPKWGTFVPGLCKANLTKGTALFLVNGEWHMIADTLSLDAGTVTIASIYSRKTVAIYADDDADTSTTAANKLLLLLGK